ncbi:hypothetical protein A6B39_05405 [Mannheimia granulomatis]|uniref:hypothetical protein n=1 Tax=Mannheimia granulomatis TaxID=85402 RepID=UPI00159DF364|nr:hypothetical protein [Mannheimia granulomatis]QLB14931.1 hypothetical protein A6B39_05405 [Mannheimia granulomatis]
MGNIFLFIMLFIITFFTTSIFNKIGLENVGFIFAFFLDIFIVWIFHNDQKMQKEAEEIIFNKQLEDELKRSVVKNKLCHLPSNNIDDEISTIAKGKVSWTDKDGKTTDLFDIEINIKSK